MSKQSVLTAAGEQFLSDILQEYRDREEDYLIYDLCEEWGLEYVHDSHVKIPQEYGEYESITTRDVPLLLKTQFGTLNSTEIRTNSRDPYPYFHNEGFGEICLWEEAHRRGKPHTELFAPVFRYDESNFEWAIVVCATDIQDRGLPATKRVEERGRELGWAPDDTEVGLLDGEYVAIDYGCWWRQNDEWVTDANERSYIDMSTYDDGVETQISGNAITHDLDNTHDTHHDTTSSAYHETDASKSQQSRFHRWLSSLLS